MRNLLASYRLIFLVIIITSLSVFSQDIKFSGWGAAGYRIFARNILNGYNQEGYYEGKLQADIEYNKDIDAQLDFRGNSTDKSVDFREFSIKFKFFKYVKFKLGNTKRPFTSQYFLENRESLLTTERSFVVNKLNEIGFGGRSLSFTAYYKYSEKRSEVPISYYVSGFTNNSLNRGVASRFSYHTGNSAISINYLFQNNGGEEPINTHGLSSDFNFKSKHLRFFLEIYYVQDPVEGVIRRLQDKDEIVYTGGGSIGGSYKFDTDGSVVKKIEPVLLVSAFVPNTKITDNHVLQSVIGINVYFHKKVYARLNADLRLTKNQFNSEYSTNESKTVFELFLNF